MTTLDLDKMEAVGLMLPNVEVPVVHHFGPGIYMREAIMPVGLFIGRAHREPCQNLMVSGCLSLFTPNGWQTLEGPQTFTSQPGRKMALVHAPTVFLNIWATTETDLAVLEARLFDDSPYMGEWRDAVMQFARAQAEPDRADFAAFLAASPWTADEVRALSERTDDMVPMPAPWSATLQVLDSPIEGQGLFTSVPISAGDVIAPARINGKRTPAGRYINHSHRPNAKMVDTGGGHIVVVALRGIAGCHGGDAGEEITVDYRHAINVGRQP
jgi:hypothetical protein